MDSGEYWRAAFYKLEDEFVERGKELAAKDARIVSLEASIKTLTSGDADTAKYWSDECLKAQATFSALNQKVEKVRAFLSDCQSYGILRRIGRR